MADKSLQNKVALITGGAHGLGRATAFELAGMGAHIAILDQHKKGAIKVADDLKSQGVKAIGLGVDVSDGEGVYEAVEQVRGELGDPLITIANAGIAGNRNPFHLAPREDWERIFQIHVDGAYYVIKATIDAMLKAGWGRIVCTASIAATMGLPNVVAYAAAKGALIGMVRALAQECATTGVTVNAVAPGYIETGLSKILPPAAVAERRDAIPMKRFGEPEDIAAAMAYLCGDSGNYVTGQVISPNGGII